MDRAGHGQLDPTDLRCAADCDSSVLISGGDHLIRATLAQMIHANGVRPGGRFVSFDRAEDALPWMLGDTLFVEELSRLTAVSGDRLARLIELDDHPSMRTPRIIAATGEPMDQRPLTVPIPEELFYRLNVIHIVLPAVIGPLELASIFGRRGL